MPYRNNPAWKKESKPGWNLLSNVFKVTFRKKKYANGGSISPYPVIKLALTATDLPNLEMVGQSDPYYELYGYTLTGECQLMYTSEVIQGNIEFVKWKEAIFAISKSTIFSKFRIVIYDKEVVGKDRLLVDPIEVTIKQLEERKMIDLGSGKAKLKINKFEKLST